MNDARLPRIDANLHKALKMKAALDGKSMKAFVEDLLQRCVEENKATKKGGK